MTDAVMSRWKQRIGWLVGLPGVAGVVVFCAIPVEERDSPDSDFDMQVVLGGNTRERGGISHALWRTHPAPILVTGDGGLIVAELRRLGVPEGAILREGKAHTTWENAARSAPILRRHGAESVVIVTSDYHTARARACFEALAPDLQFFTRATPREPRSGWVRFRLRLRERCARVGYGMSHGLNPWSSSR